MVAMEAAWLQRRQHGCTGGSRMGFCTPLRHAWRLSATNSNIDSCSTHRPRTSLCNQQQWVRAPRPTATPSACAQFYLGDDRLCYLVEGSPGSPDNLGGGRVRYISLDRIPVRPLPVRQKRVHPHELTPPDIGVHIVPIHSHNHKCVSSM
jgi:hypothetical protein